MNSRDFRRFNAAMTACAELYGRTLSEAALALWWKLLEPYDIELVERALHRALESPDGGQFMPKPADLIRQLRGHADDDALIAWGKVLQQAQRGGGGNFAGAAKQAIDSLGGWSVICRADESQNGFLQRRFCDAFKAYRSRETSPPLLLVEQGATAGMLA